MGNQQNAKRNFVREELEQIFISRNKSELDQNMNNLFNKTLSDEEIFMGINANEIRQYMNIRQNSVEQLIYFQIDFLSEITQDITKKFSSLEENLIKNVLRFLTVLIPILHEVQFEEYQRKLLWDYDNPNYSVQEVGIQEGQKDQRMIIYRADDNEINKKREESKPYAIKILNSLEKLLFHPKFTIENSENLMWYDLVGLKNSLNSNQINHKAKYFKNRIVVLQCLLACLGKTLYSENNENFYNPMILYLISPKNQYSSTLFFSLLFFLLQHRDKRISLIPDALIQDRVAANKLADICAQVLLISVDYKIEKNQIQNIFRYSIELHQIYDDFSGLQEIETPGNSSLEKSQSEIHSIFVNNFVEIIKNMKKLEIISPIMQNMLEHLEIPMQNEQSLLIIPNKQEFENYSNEMIGLFQQLLIINKDIIRILISSQEDFERLFKALIYNFCYSQEDSENQNKIYFVILSILTELTQNKIFCEMLNRNMNFTLTFKNLPLVSGTYMDLLYIAISTTILNSYENNYNRYSFNLMGILLNISSYVQNLSKLASVKLLQLLLLFTNYSFQLQNLYHPYCLVKLMQVIDNLISFQYSTNSNLILEMWKRKQHFLRVNKLSFDERAIDYFISDMQQNNDNNKKGNKFVGVQGENNPNQNLKAMLKQMWKGFNWKQVCSQIEFSNIFLVFKELDDLQQKSQLNQTEIDLKAIRLIIDKKSFQDLLKKNKNIILEGFLNQDFAQNICHQFCWNLILMKNNFIPCFSYSQSQFISGNNNNNKNKQQSSISKPFQPNIVSSNTQSQIDRGQDQINYEDNEDKKGTDDEQGGEDDNEEEEEEEGGRGQGQEQNQQNQLSQNQKQNQLVFEQQQQQYQQQQQQQFQNQKNKVQEQQK